MNEDQLISLMAAQIYAGNGLRDVYEAAKEAIRMRQLVLEAMRLSTPQPKTGSPLRTGEARNP